MPILREKHERSQSHGTDKHASRILRRQCLKLAVAAPLGFAAAVGRGQAPSDPSSTRRRAGDRRPNLVIVVFDTLSAPHMSLYGYPRRTTPAIEQFAEQATVFHRHYSGGNFTSPGTATLLTGVYPWRNRAFNVYGTVNEAYEQRNLFRVLGQLGYSSLAYTHNWVANFLLLQLQKSIDRLLDPSASFISGAPLLPALFSRDKALAYRAELQLWSIENLGEGVCSSLFSRVLSRIRFATKDHNARRGRTSVDFPKGLPVEGSCFALFRLEDAVDNMLVELDRMPEPFIAYLHLYPPHAPYNPPARFLEKFNDSWTPVVKRRNSFSDGRDEEQMNEDRRRYDQHLAYADSEFGRFYQLLKKKSYFDDTAVVLTSDHGELFERGIRGHATPCLYESVVRVPFLVHLPHQTEREDVTIPTSAVDVVPSLVNLAGGKPPAWTEGRILPGFGSDRAVPEAPVFSMDAKENPRLDPLRRASVAVVDGRHKLVQYLGYGAGRDGFELYDLIDDPEELRNLHGIDARTENRLRKAIADKLEQMNRPTEGSQL